MMLEQHLIHMFLHVFSIEEIMWYARGQRSWVGSGWADTTVHTGLNNAEPWRECLIAPDAQTIPWRTSGSRDPRCTCIGCLYQNETIEVNRAA